MFQTSLAQFPCSIEGDGTVSQTWEYRIGDTKTIQNVTAWSMRDPDWAPRARELGDCQTTVCHLRIKKAGICGICALPMTNMTPKPRRQTPADPVPKCPNMSHHFARQSSSTASFRTAGDRPNFYKFAILTLEN